MSEEIDGVTGCMECTNGGAFSPMQNWQELPTEDWKCIISLPVVLYMKEK
jgi:hypothetical protein